MIGEIIVTLIVAAIVTTYMATVNWFLRGDEHYHDDAPARTPARRTAEPSAGYGAGIPART